MARDDPVGRAEPARIDVEVRICDFDAAIDDLWTDAGLGPAPSADAGNATTSSKALAVVVANTVRIRLPAAMLPHPRDNSTYYWFTPSRDHVSASIKLHGMGPTVELG